MPKRPEPWWREDRKAWFVQINRKRHNLGKNKKEAWKRYYQLMAEPPQSSRVVLTNSLLTIIDAFLEYCQKHRAADTYEWYRSRLQRFAQTYPALRVGELRSYHVQQWIDGMDVASGTKRNYGRAIKRCIRWAKRQGHLDRNPIADLELPKGGKREVVISETEWQTILQLTPDPSLRDLLIITWETGPRPQESLVVESRHVDVPNQRWVFPESESKTDIPRVVYLTDQALALSQRLMLQNPTGPLFRNSRGKPWTTDAVNNAFVRIQIRLGRKALEKSQSQTGADRRKKYLGLDDRAVAEMKKTLNPRKRCGRPKTKAELRHEARRKLTYQQATKYGKKYSLYTIRHTWMNRLLKRGGRCPHGRVPGRRYGPQYPGESVCPFVPRSFLSVETG